MPFVVEGLNQHFTASNITLEAQRRRTFPGMAHFAGTGPAGETCRGCEFWKHDRQYYSKIGHKGGLIRPAPCTKYREMMGDWGNSIPDDAPSCKYFAPAHVVPDRFYK